MSAENAVGNEEEKKSFSQNMKTAQPNSRELDTALLRVPHKTAAQV